MFYNVVSHVHLHETYRGRVTWNDQSWIAMDLSNRIFGGLCSFTSKLDWKQLDQRVASTALLARTLSLRARHKIGSLAFASKTMTSKIRHGQVVQLGSVMSTWVSCLRSICSRQHVSLWKLERITTDCDWALEGTWLSVQAAEVGTPPRDRVTTPAPCWGSRFTAFFEVHQDLDQLCFPRRLKLGSVLQCSAQTVVVPTRRTHESDSQAWAPYEKGNAVSVVGPEGHVAVWTAGTPHHHHCKAVLPSIRLSGWSDSTEAPGTRPHLLPSRQLQTPDHRPHLPEPA